MSNYLILRTLNSPFVSPYGDIKKGSILSAAELDGNQIYLKGNIIYTGTSSSTTLILNKLNGNNVSVDLSGLIGSPSYSQYINVTASTPDNYVGVGDPTITGYSTEVIYLITFTDTNVTSATTINIDGQGVLDLFIPTEDGLEGPVPSGITSGISYFMTYNGSSMQLFDTNPSSSALLYTNPAPTPATVGGIVVGSSFSGVTMQEMWTSLLYPYLNPAITGFTISGQAISLEVGDSIAAGAKTFTWGISNNGNIQANSIKIKNFNTNTIISTPVTGIPNDGSEIISIGSITKTIPTYQRFIIYANTIKGSQISRNFNVNWYNRVYYGTSTATTLTANQITGLTSSVLTSTAMRTYSLVADNYKYICIPTALTNPSLFRDASTNLTVAMAGPADGYPTANNGYYVDQVVVTNVYGVNVTYDVYRTKNILGSQISVITS